MGQTIQGLPGEGNLQGSRCAELGATTRGSRLHRRPVRPPSAGRVHSRLARLSGNCRNEPCGPEFFGVAGQTKTPGNLGSATCKRATAQSNHETSRVPFLSRSGAAQAQLGGRCGQFLRLRRAHQIHGHPMRPRPLDGGRFVRATASGRPETPHPISLIIPAGSGKIGFKNVW